MEVTGCGGVIVLDSLPSLAGWGDLQVGMNWEEWGGGICIDLRLFFLITYVYGIIDQGIYLVQKKHLDQVVCGDVQVHIVLKWLYRGMCGFYLLARIMFSYRQRFATKN